MVLLHAKRPAEEISTVSEQSEVAADPILETLKSLKIVCLRMHIFKIVF